MAIERVPGPEEDLTPPVEQANKPAVIQGAVAKGVGADLTADKRISNMDELRELAPDVYDKMMKSIATNIIRQTNNFRERIKDAYKNG